MPNCITAPDQQHQTDTAVYTVLFFPTQIKVILTTTLLFYAVWGAYCRPGVSDANIDGIFLSTKI